MSAITGIYFLDGRPVDQAILTEMTRKLAHRGRDGEGLWLDGSIGFGHRQLWTTPESLHEAMPLVGQGGRLVLVADARIDNRAELLPQLFNNGRRPEEITDAELILAAYAHWNTRCPEQLEGDFAFAIWDGSTRELFCARDPLGVRPFHYYKSDRGFVFASELKALFCVPEVPRRLNEMRIADYLVAQFDDTAITFFEDITRLSPGCCMSVSEKGVRQWRYWTPDAEYELRLRCDQEYAEAYREVFTRAVSRRLRSAFPVGAMLSGGLDSSSITCVARNWLAQNNGACLHTFSGVFDDVPVSDERPYITAVLDQGGVTPHFVRGDLLSPLADLDRVLWHEDEAFYTFNLFLGWGVWGLAQQQGVRVMLDGFVGDTTTPHGFPYLVELAYRWRWVALAREIHDLAPIYQQAAWPSIWAHMWNFGLRPYAPPWAKAQWRRIKGTSRPLPNTTSIVHPQFARRINLTERVRTLKGSSNSPTYSAREHHHRSLMSGEVAYALEVLNKASAAFSIDVRLPFTDRRLVEFCLALPPEQNLHAGHTRRIVREALGGSLPEKVRWRHDKGNLGPNFERALLTYERGTLDDVILKNPHILEAYVDVPLLQETYRRYIRQGHGDDVLPIWLAVTLALWLRRIV